VAFEWDEAKARENFRKHGVLFSSEALGVFDDDYALTVNDDDSDSAEQRVVTLAMGSKGRLLVVVYTYRQEDIRIISARLAEPHEHDQYKAQL